MNERIADTLEHLDNGQVTLHGMLRSIARAQGDRIYASSSSAGVTYSEMVEQATRSAGVMARLGIAPGCVIVASITDGLQLLRLFWCCMANGVTIALLPEIADAEMLRARAAEVGASVILCDRSLTGEASGAIVAAEQFEAEVRQEPLRSDPLEDALSSGGSILFRTSGTTGEAKWIRVREHQYLIVLRAMLRAGCLDHAVGQTVFLTPRLSHSYGLSALLEYTAIGAEVVLPPGHHPLGCVAELGQPFASKCTAIEAVPHFYRQMTALLDRLPSLNLRHLGIGGGAMNVAAMRQLLERFRGARISVRYGLTETPSVVSMNVFQDLASRDTGSSGRILPIYQLRVVNACGARIEDGAEGGIELTGSSVSLGDGEHWLKTGDIGYIRAGELFITGRQSAFIDSRGMRVSPDEVEDVISLSLGVSDCRVLMDRSGVFTAEVVADRSQVTDAALRRRISELLPSYARPQRIIYVERVPRTASGKIIRASTDHGCGNL